MPMTMSCPGCGRTGRIPDELQGKQVKCPKCGAIFGGESPQQEIVFFEERGVKVTNIRFILRNQTYAISGINSVGSFEERRLVFEFVMVVIPCLAILLLSILWVSLVCSLLTLSDGIGGLLFVSIVPVPTLMVLKFLVRYLKPTYWIRLDTSGGRVRAFRSSNQDFIQRIVKAVNDAIIARE